MNSSFLKLFTKKIRPSFPIHNVRPRPKPLVLEHLEDRIVQANASSLYSANPFQAYSTSAPQSALTSAAATYSVLAPTQQASQTVDLTPYLNLLHPGYDAATPATPVGTVELPAGYEVIGPGMNVLGGQVQETGRIAIANKVAKIREQGLVNLGNPLAGFETSQPTADQYGRYQVFQGGSIYWSPGTAKIDLAFDKDSPTAGAHFISGPIRDKFFNMGAERFGYPRDDQSGLSNWPGFARADFYNDDTKTTSFIVHTPGNGAHVLKSGAISAEWFNLGTGIYGAPVGEEYVVRGGFAQDFVLNPSRGFPGQAVSTIAYSEHTGAHDVVDVGNLRTRTEWVNLGGVKTWGFPTVSQSYLYGTSLFSRGVMYFKKTTRVLEDDGSERFDTQSAAIAHSNAGFAHVYGGIYQAWRKLGGESFGYPISSEADTENGYYRFSQFSHFEAGATEPTIRTIYWLKYDGSVSVDLGNGAILNLENVGTTSAPLTVDKSPYDLSSSYQSVVEAQNISPYGNLFELGATATYQAANDVAWAQFAASPGSVYTGGTTDWFSDTTYHGEWTDYSSLFPGLATGILSEPETMILAAQTITMDSLADRAYGDAPIHLNATASSGLAVSYRILSGPATLADNVLTITGAGIVTLEAIQAGNEAFEAAMPIEISFAINKARLTVTADPKSRAFGQANPAFTATITGFVNGETLADSGVLGSANFSTKGTASSPVGTYAITTSPGTLTSENYDFTNFVNGSMKVKKAATTIDLKSSFNSAPVGLAITLTATVTVEGGGIPTGTITFKDGSIILGTGTLMNGIATLKNVTLALGKHSLTAVYGGTSNFMNSVSSVFTQKTLQASKTVVQTSLAAPSLGQAVTLTATVAPTSGAGTPTGIVTFKDGLVILGTATLSGGKAKLTTNLLAVGSHAITAVFAGDIALATSTSAGLTLSVKKAAITLALASSSSTVAFGQTVTLTVKASVPAGTSMPAGIVTIKDGTTVLGTATFVNGVAVFKIAKLARGKHNLTAVFGGDANFFASTSGVLLETII